MFGKAVAALVVVGAVVVIVQTGGDDIATVEYSACQNIPRNYHVHLADRSLYLPSNGQPLSKGRVYELTYVLGDGRIVSSRDLREAVCKG